MKLVMFDVDGTLTQTDQVDERCFVQTLREVFGFTNVDTDWTTYPHCSDSGILEALFQSRLGRSPLPAESSTFQGHFLSLLSGETAVEPFGAVPGARDFLCGLLGESAFAISIASGAWESSARFKLASAGLDFPEIPAAFSDDAQAREAIMQMSLVRASRVQRRESFDAIIYIGDGVWDARAARNLGFPFIGISTEPAKIEKLYAEGARHVFRDYLNVESFMTVFHEVTTNA